MDNYTQRKHGSADWGFSGNFNYGFPRTLPVAKTPSNSGTSNDKTVRPAETPRPWEQLKLF